jgi:hypothetical protein
MPTFNVSYKPQKISPKFEGSVRQLLHKKIRDSYLHPQVSVTQERTDCGVAMTTHPLAPLSVVAATVSTCMLSRDPT